MSTLQPFDFITPDLQKIQAFRWLSSTPPIACVQIAHGMAEHSLRYQDFAAFLNDHGIVVYANDHRGHGKTAGSLENRGYFADKKGWDLCVDDMFRLNGIIHQENPGIPVFLLGHSMGSFLSRAYIMRYAESISGCILSGTATHGTLLLNTARTLALLQKCFMGKRHQNKLLDKMSFGSFNKKIQHPITNFDWLTKDEKIVAGYIADDYCGFVCTTGFFIDLFSGLKTINNIRNIRQVRTDLPLYFISGAEDPVGNYGKGVSMAVEKYRIAGVKDLAFKLYEGGRHEMLNEVNKKEVWNDLLQWLIKHT